MISVQQTEFLIGGTFNEIKNGHFNIVSDDGS
jgi:hypothetical protein